jgi:signal transduction histidine kinase
VRLAVDRVPDERDVDLAWPAAGGSVGQDLLDVGIIEAGLLKVERREEDLRDLLSQALEDLQPLAAARGVVLRLEMPPAPGVVQCDRQRLFQVLSNIVGNAIKFTPEGGSIVVSSESREDAVLFTVRDPGPGIDAEH